MTIQARFDLSGRSAVVTGGGRGIGRSISQVLAEAGASLLLVGRSIQTLEKAQAELRRETSGRVEICSADLGDRAATARAAVYALETFGHVDVFVHCAAVPSSGAVDDFENAVWDTVLDTNLFAGAALTRAFLPGMKARGWGRVIYISSSAARRAMVGAAHGPYSASKAGLEGLMRSVAVEMGAFGITANCIVAGIFKTDMAMSGAKDLAEEHRKGLLDFFASQAPVGRAGECSDVEGPILLLASEAGSFITGSLLYVDGGFAVAK